VDKETENLSSRKSKTTTGRRSRRLKVTLAFSILIAITYFVTPNSDGFLIRFQRPIEETCGWAGRRLIYRILLFSSLSSRLSLPFRTTQLPPSIPTIIFSNYFVSKPIRSLSRQQHTLRSNTLLQHSRVPTSPESLCRPRPSFPVIRAPFAVHKGYQTRLSHSCHALSPGQIRILPVP